MSIRIGAQLIVLLGAAAAASPAVAHSQSAPAARSMRSQADNAADRGFALASARLRADAAEALGTSRAGLPHPPFRFATMRKSITLLSAAELASLRRGIAQMIAWNSAPAGSANFKRSLKYWANMHSYIGAPCSANSGLSHAGMSGLSLQSATTPDELATWCDCQHGTDQFLTWHRMYLFYFEKVLQQAAGDLNLRLPFWDYESDGHLPPAYRAATYVDSHGATVANPLYIANRQPQLNAGTAALDPSVTATSAAMVQADYGDFEDQIENTPHGAVHCATGVAGCPTGYMGYVPSAGNDPIFYSHHANIDRLYECWLKVNQAARLPSDPTQLAQQFSFIDGAGTLVTRRVGDMLTTAQLGYSYAAGGGCPLVLHLPPIPILVQLPWKVYPLAGPVTLQRGTTVVPIRIAPETTRSMTMAVPGAKGRAPRAQLVIEGLRFDEIPGVLYKVYLQGAGGKRIQIGVINFFNATAPQHEGMAAMRGAGMGALRFEATEAVRALGGAAGASLVLEPSSGITGGRALVATEAIGPRANVHFDSARIELR